MQNRNGRENGTHEVGLKGKDKVDAKEREREREREIGGTDKVDIKGREGEDGSSPSPANGGDEPDGHRCNVHGSDTESEGMPDPSIMFEYMNQMFNQQQGSLANVLGAFLTTEDKNICQCLEEIRDAINTNSRCILRLCDTVLNLREPSKGR